MSDTTNLAVLGQSRPMLCVRRGWHVWFPDGRWRLVERAHTDAARRFVYVTFADDEFVPVKYVADAEVPTRTPAEQISATLLEERRRRLVYLRGYRDRRQLTRLVSAIWGGPGQVDVEVAS